MFQPSHTTVIDVRSGYKIDVEEEDCEIRNNTQSFNPLISLIEKTGSVETVFNQMHREGYKAKRVILFYDRKLWIELVHKKLDEYIESSVRLFSAIDEKEFGLHGKIVLKKDLKYYISYIIKKLENLIFFSKSLIERGVKVIVGKQ